MPWIDLKMVDSTSQSGFAVALFQEITDEKDARISGDSRIAAAGRRCLGR
jgi:hypothetical protein